jgi:hypothetical protein
MPLKSYFYFWSTPKVVVEQLYVTKAGKKLHFFQKFLSFFLFLCLTYNQHLSMLAILLILAVHHTICIAWSNW